MKRRQEPTDATDSAGSRTVDRANAQTTPVETVQTHVGNRTLGRLLTNEDVSIRELRRRSEDRFERDADRKAATMTETEGTPTGIVGLFAANWGLDPHRVQIGRDVTGVGRSLHADAVTVGSTILFRPGAYVPERGDGGALLAHELGHVQQHHRGRGTGIAAQSMAQPTGEVLAENPDHMADLVEDVLLVTLDQLLMGEVDADGTDRFIQNLEAAIDFYVPPELAAELHRDVARLDYLVVYVDRLELDIVGTAALLIWLLGLPPMIAHDDDRVSYGVDRYIELVTDAIGRYLALELDLAELVDYFAVLVSGLGDPIGILEAELAGIMREYDTRVAAARGQFEDADVGELARQALLLYDEIENLREIGIADEDIGDVVAIEAYVDHALDRLVDAETEERTRSALGDELSLLARHELDLETPFADQRQPAVDPEAAFPETTQRTVEAMTEQAQSRVDELARDVTDLRGEVVPTDPNFTFEEFVGVYRRWLGFFSPEARDADFQYAQMVDFYRAITGIIKQFGGHEGGIARYFLIQLLFGWQFPLPDATNIDFVTELAEPSRTAETTGTPDDPSYAFAQLFDGRDPSAAAEEQSRRRFMRGTRASRERAFQWLDLLAQRERPLVESAHELGLLERPEGVIVGDIEREDQPPFASWSYFLSQMVETGLGQQQHIHERREMPVEVGEYLLGAAQLLGALEERHVPRVDVDGESVPIGDAVTRTAGLDITPPGTAAGTIEPGRELPTIDEVTSALLRDLRGYLDEYINQAEPIERVAVTYIVAAGEHGAQDAFARHFDFRSIAMAVAQAIAMHTALFALRVAGPMGRILATAIPKAMNKLGVGGDTQVVMAVLGWINAAQEVSSFRHARIMAVPAGDLMDELGSVIQGKVVGAFVDFTKASWEYSKLRDDPLTRMDLFEQLSGDRIMREIMLEEIDVELNRLREGSGNQQEIDLLEQTRNNILQNY